MVGTIDTAGRAGPRALTRRQLLSRATAAGAGFVVGSGFMAARDGAWAVELNALKPHSFATLVQMARDIYPHDRVADEHYVVAVRDYDDPQRVDDTEAGIEMLDAAARDAGHGLYLDIGWERDRVAVLRGIEDTPFFQTIRGGLVTGLYNQKAVWPIFGYEGSSFEHGGYVDRGFDDIAWIG